ncbi:MAG: TolC family outer membrane protein [Brevirhabdus sp.]
MIKVFKRAIQAGIFATGALAAPLAQAETLTDALVSAYRNSALLDQNRALLRAADENIAGAVAGLRPVINYVATVSRSDPNRLSQDWSASATVQLQWLLWDFGATQLRAESLKETVLATRSALVNLEQSVLLDAATAYLNYRSAAESAALARNNQTLITRELRAAQDRFDVGEVTRTDVALAQSRLAASRANLVAAEGQLAVARETYKLAVGKYPGRLSPPPPVPATARSVEEARAIALRSHPSILQAQHEVRAQELNLERAHASMKPTLTLNAQRGYSVASRDSASVALNLNANLYSGGARVAAYRAEFARAEASRSNLLQTTRTVSQNVANAWAQLAVARAQIQATDQQIRAAEVAFRGIREEATLGARTTLDVLDAEQELLDARNARVDAITQQYSAVYGLLAAMGLLTVDHLKLGIQTYDPSVYYKAVRNAPISTIQGDRLDKVLRALGKTAPNN